MPSVLILGAASDMAIAIARKFAKEGYDIQLAARQSARLSSLCTDLGIRAGVHCSVHEFDALDFSSHKNFIDALPALPDVTFCVFGLLGENENALSDWSQAERIIHSNYTGAVSILNLIAKQYEQRGSGTIVGISSVAGERGRQSNFLYGSAKAGFTAYLSGLRNRLYHSGVHVVSIQPGFVNTKMTSELKLPPLLTAQPSEVAEAAFKAVRRKSNTVYVKWYWKYIMLIIRNIPEPMFKKMKL